LAYIAAAARQAGAAVDLVDAYALRWTWPRFAAEVRRRQPDVLGLSAMTPVADVAARAARECRPHVGRIVLGGPHPTAVGVRVFDEIPELDAAVVGEGEEIIGPLLSWLDRRDGPPPPGVLAPGHPFVETTPSRPIAAIARPARDLLPNHAYRYLMATRPGFGTMITSRGCPFRCTFCDKSVSGSRWRARPAGDVADEMIAMRRRHGIRFVNFYDDNFTLRRDRVARICEALIRQRVDVEWKCEGRVDGVDLPLLKLMRRAGCRVVAYGVESGNEQTLSLLRKDITVEQTRRAFEQTRAAGLRSLAYMILGAPGESADEVENSIRFCREIGADYVQFSSLVAMPGTPLFDTARATVDVKNPLDGDQSRATVSDLPAETLAGLMRSAWMGFYLRPRALGRLARDAVVSRSLGEAMRMGVGLARWGMAA